MRVRAGQGRVAGAAAVRQQSTLRKSRSAASASANCVNSAPI